MSFKRFLMISQRTKTSLVNELMNRDLTQLTQKNAHTSEMKWQARKNYVAYKPQPEDKQTANKQRLNPLRGVPNSFCELLKTQLRICPKHPKMITDSWHMKYYHHCYIKPVGNIWKEDIKPLIKQNLERKIITSNLIDLIGSHVNIYKNYLNLL